jgi:hypothetical protein
VNILIKKISMLEKRVLLLLALLTAAALASDDLRDV